MNVSFDLNDRSLFVNICCVIIGIIVLIQILLYKKVKDNPAWFKTLYRWFPMILAIIALIIQCFLFRF